MSVSSESGLLRAESGCGHGCGHSWCVGGGGVVTMRRNAGHGSGGERNTHNKGAQYDT